jgi:hypothetical protein
VTRGFKRTVDVRGVAHISTQTHPRTTRPSKNRPRSHQCPSAALAIPSRPPPRNSAGGGESRRRHLQSRRRRGPRLLPASAPRARRPPGRATSLRRSSSHHRGKETLTLASPLRASLGFSFAVFAPSLDMIHRISAFASRMGVQVRPFHRRFVWCEAE